MTDRRITIATGALALALLTVTLPLAAQQRGPGPTGRGCGQALSNRSELCAQSTDVTSLV